MATYWLGEGGNDGNNGTTYALRKLTPSAALALLTTKGDILNIVGTVDMESSQYVINGISLGNAGTSYDDPALIIRGTDSSGDPAIATLLGDATHYHFVTFDDRVNFAIIRGIHIDQSTTTNNYATYPIRVEGWGRTPVLIQYCIFEGDPTEQTPGQWTHAVHAIATAHADQHGGLESINEVLVQHCYFDHSSMHADNAHLIHADHCVFYTTTFSVAASPPVAVDMDTNTTRSNVGVKMTNCTLDYWHACSTVAGARHFNIVGDYLTDGTPLRDREIHSNLICVASSELMAANQLWNGGMIDSGNLNITGLWSGTMGYNAFVFDTNVTSTIASTSVVDFYENHFHPDQPDTVTGTQLYDTDVLLNNDVIGSVINETSAWTWTDINNSGYDIDLPKDYRLSHSGNIVYMTMAEDGGRVGAVQENVNRAPSGLARTYRVNENNVLTVNATNGMLAGATDPDGDTVFATSLTTPTHGTLVSYNITTGSFVYRPDAYYSGGDSFTFKITDGDLSSDATTVTIAVFSTGSAVVTNIIDTAPFYRPTLEVRTEFGMKSTKNRVKHRNINNYTEDRDWNESTHRVINVGAATTVQVTLGGVAEAQYMIVETDNDIDVSINDAARYWTVSKCAAVALGSITTIYLKNNSAANVAQVKLCVAD